MKDPAECGAGRGILGASRAMEEQAKSLDVMMQFFRLARTTAAVRVSSEPRRRPVDTRAAPTPAAGRPGS